jgi:hypothetical protein
MKRINRVLAIFILIVIFASSIEVFNVLAQEAVQRKNLLAPEIMELSSLLRDLQSIEKDKKLAITKKQSEKLIPILQDLGKKNLLPAKEAEKFIEKIEGVLTDAQITFLDRLTLEREKEREERLKEMQSGNRSNTQQQQNPQRQIEKEMQQVIDAWQNGKSLSPFYYVPSWKKLLNELINILKKK